MRAANGWLRNLKLYLSTSTRSPSSPLVAMRTENAPSTGQSIFGVNCSCLSLTQNQVPSIAGSTVMPAVTGFCSCFSGAADSLKTIVTGLIDEMPSSLYSVRPGPSIR